MAARDPVVAFHAVLGNTGFLQPLIQQFTASRALVAIHNGHALTAEIGG